MEYLVTVVFLGLIVYILRDTNRTSKRLADYENRQL